MSLSTASTRLRFVVPITASCPRGVKSNSAGIGGLQWLHKATPQDRHQPRRRPKPSKAKFKRMVEEAIVDAYGKSEQVCGFYTMLENDLELPFNTVVLDAGITVERLDLTDDDQIVVVCRRGRKQ